MGKVTRTHVFHIAKRVVDGHNISAIFLAGGTADKTADTAEAGDAHFHHWRRGYLRKSTSGVSQRRGVRDAGVVWDEGGRERRHPLRLRVGGIMWRDEQQEGEGSQEFWSAGASDEVPGRCESP